MPVPCQLAIVIDFANLLYSKACSLCADANMHTDSHHTHRNECMHACNMLTKCTSMVSSMHICTLSMSPITTPMDKTSRPIDVLLDSIDICLVGKAILEGVGIVTEQTAW